MAQFLNHFHVVLYAFLNALSLDVVAYFFEIKHLLHQVVLNLVDGYVGLLLRGHEKVGWVQAVFVETGQSVKGNGIHLFDGVDLIVPECDAEYHLAIGHRNIYGIALYAEVTSLQIQVVSYV